MAHTDPIRNLTELVNEREEEEELYPIATTTMLIRENAYRIGYAADNVDFFGRAEGHIEHVQKLIEAQNELNDRLIQQLREFWDAFNNDPNFLSLRQR